MTEQFGKYQWITAFISKNPGDARPESYRVDWDSIECGEKIPTTPDEWGRRADVLFRNGCWQFQTMEKLQEAQKAGGTSIGVVTPRQIRKVDVVSRDETEIRSFDDKFNDLQRRLEAQRAQLTLFEEAVPPEMKRLDFLRARIQINWLCRNPACRGHKMQVLDWEVCELQRKRGDDEALRKVREITDLSRFDLRFFLGNLFLYPQNFMVVGLWYPKRANLLFR